MTASPIRLPKLMWFVTGRQPETVETLQHASFSAAHGRSGVADFHAKAMGKLDIRVISCKISNEEPFMKRSSIYIYLLQYFTDQAIYGDPIGKTFNMPLIFSVIFPRALWKALAKFGFVNLNEVKV
jgi:hypothetical protein